MGVLVESFNGNELGAELGSRDGFKLGTELGSVDCIERDVDGASDRKPVGVLFGESEATFVGVSDNTELGGIDGASDGASDGTPVVAPVGVP